MRMWMLSPEFMCLRHLLGEHVECHMLASSIILHKTLDGYAHNHLIELTSLQSRHDALALEITRRGYHHYSPLPSFSLSNYSSFITSSRVDLTQSYQALLSRCPRCRTNYGTLIYRLELSQDFL